MKKTFNGVAMAGTNLLLCAIDAMKEVRLAEAADAPKDEIARLQLLADSAYETAIGYQCRFLGLDKTLTH